MFVRRADPVMTRYKNLNGESNVKSYEIRSDGIIIKFKSGEYKNFLFNNAETGEERIEKMKLLAEVGSGLDSYINDVVKGKHYRRW